MGRKLDALNLLLHAFRPQRAILFCNTKKMVEEVAQYLTDHHFQAVGLHGDMRQGQRTQVMADFKSGKTAILVATDVAARGIDVSDIDYVINYDIPQNTEYYIHRIGRTGRAGKEGCALTLCCGRRQVGELLQIARMTKSNVERKELPKAQEIRMQRTVELRQQLKQALQEQREFPYLPLIQEFKQEGILLEELGAYLLEKQMGPLEMEIPEVHSPAPKIHPKDRGRVYAKIVLAIGREEHVTPNHIVGAITERTHLLGQDIGKIEIFPHFTLVGVPKEGLKDTVEALKKLKICGKPVAVSESSSERSNRLSHRAPSSSARRSHRDKGNSHKKFSKGPVSRGDSRRS